MLSVLIIIVGVAEAGLACGLMWQMIGKKATALKKNLQVIEDELQKKEELQNKITGLFERMVDIGTLRSKADEFFTHQESLKAERGRITITQAELETVESRLRELEEIERELEASGVETKEEINILIKKKDDLFNKNDVLRQELERSLEQMESILSEIEMTAQMAERIDAMKTELVQIQRQIDQLLIQVEQGNEQYFILKKRYDALDIEYAQLYEKFSASEVLASEGG